MSSIIPAKFSEEVSEILGTGHKDVYKYNPETLYNKVEGFTWVIIYLIETKKDPIFKFV